MNRQILAPVPFDNFISSFRKYLQAYTLTSLMEENPYQLTDRKILEPPTTFTGKLRYLGPSFILSASIVGSGELFATTLLHLSLQLLYFALFLMLYLMEYLLLLILY